MINDLFMVAMTVFIMALHIIDGWQDVILLFLSAK